MRNAHLVDSWLKCSERVNRNVVDFRMLVYILYCFLYSSLLSLSILLSDLPAPWCFLPHVCFYFVFMPIDTRGVYLHAIVHHMPHLFCRFVLFCEVEDTGSAKRRKSICIYPLDYRGHKNEIKSFFATSSCNYHANGMRAIAKPCAGCVVLCCIS